MGTHLKYIEVYFRWLFLFRVGKTDTKVNRKLHPLFKLLRKPIVFIAIFWQKPVC